MIYTNDVLKKMDDRRVKNHQYSRYFKRLFYEIGGQDKVVIDKDTGEVKVYPDFQNDEQKKMFNRAENINNCLNFWSFNKYEESKILDLQFVNRCKNTRFCPNCKVLEAAKYIHKITPIYEEMLQNGYHFYFLTLTIPSIKTLDPNELKSSVSKLYTNFRKLQELFSRPLSSAKAFHYRSVEFYGGIRVLEITHNYQAGFHPHLHCIIVCKDEIPADLLELKYKAKYSRKRHAIDYKNDIEVEIAKVWSLIVAEKYSEYNFKNYDYDASVAFSQNLGIKNLEVNFRDLDADGFKETFKYTVKSSEINSYRVFKCLFYTLFGRRVRQGFGCMYRLSINDCIDDEGESIELPPECENETPDALLVANMKKLYTFYADYKKISRFNAAKADDISYYQLQD